MEKSVHAVEAQASRIHANLKVLAVCPACDAVGVRLNRQSGMYPLCTEERPTWPFNELLRTEATGRERSRSSTHCGESTRGCGRRARGFGGATGCRGGASGTADDKR